MVEGYVVLIAACVPTLPPVYDRFTGRSKTITRICPFPLPRNSYTACFGRSSSPSSSSSKQHFWSAIMKPSFGTSHTGGSAGSSSRQWSLTGVGGGGGGGMCTSDWASPRTLEDAANLAYPPAAIWKQTVRVGQHSRLRSQDHESF